jgi:antibiotic biosynthesis monooxygenase (ABM) superfamily enzyme
MCKAWMHSTPLLNKSIYNKERLLGYLSSMISKGICMVQRSRWFFLPWLDKIYNSKSHGQKEAQSSNTEISNAKEVILSTKPTSSW